MSQVESESTAGSAVDKLMLAAAVLALLAGIVGFHQLAESSVWVRAAALVGGIVVAVVIALLSQSGRRFIGFSQLSIDEARKVVWPTRKETIQTTLIVFAFVLVMALFLWLADKVLEWVLYDLILGWRR
jgi:preprotein translocase subunit SecE